jgi:hypothetical protein
MLSLRECSARLVPCDSRSKVDAFSAGLIVRIPEAWQITEAGRTIQARLQSGDDRGASHRKTNTYPSATTTRLASSRGQCHAPDLRDARQHAVNGTLPGTGILGAETGTEKRDRSTNGDRHPQTLR